MAITSIGLLLIPPSVAIFLLWPKYLVPWGTIVSVFSAASVISFGGSFPIGIAPFPFVAVLIAIRFGRLYFARRLSFARSDPVLPLIRSVLMFTAWGVISAFLLPVMFANLEVNAARTIIEEPTPLHWTVSNGAQAGYLILDCLFIMYVIWVVAKDPAQLELLMSAFKWSGVVALTVGGYEFLAHLTGLPFPTDFFHSNQAMAQLITEKIAGTWRLSATASEPAAAGGLFACWSAFLLSRVCDRATARRFDWVLLCGGIAMLILTTSSTGYIAAIALLAFFFWQQGLRPLIRGRVNPRMLLVCAAVAAAAIVTLTQFPDFHQLLAQVFWEKNESMSGRERLSTIWRAFDLVGESWGLGVGLGSDRASGMLFYVLSNLGVPGVMLLGHSIYVTGALACKACNPSLVDRAILSHIRASAWAFAVGLLAMATAGSEVAGYGFWLVWSILAASISGAHAQQQQIRFNESFPIDAGERAEGRMIVLRPGQAVSGNRN